MTLLEKQQLFPRLFATLVDYCMDRGYQLTLGETYRPNETAELYAKQGKGIANSLHRIRLAVDINLFKDGVFLTKSEDYAAVGSFWKGLSVPGEYECAWGGDFARPDGNHLSIEHSGVR